MIVIKLGYGGSYGGDQGGYGGGAGGYGGGGAAQGGAVETTQVRTRIVNNRVF